MTDSATDLAAGGRPVTHLRPSGPTDVAFFALLSGSYQRFLKESLVSSGWNVAHSARWLYAEAPYCVLAHEPGPDPRFIYANATAQTCFEYTWEELTALPSRLSAEAPDRDERQRLLDAVTQNGFATGYRGLRIAKSGRRFWIEDVTVWQLVDEQGVLHGQAATYRHWRDA